MKKFILVIFMFLASFAVEASAFNVLYFHDASVVDVYTILQLKRMDGLQGLHLLNADKLTKAQLCALKELPLKELGLGVTSLCGQIRRTIVAMPSIRKLVLKDVTKINDNCLDMFSPMLVELDIRNVKSISPLFAEVLSKTKIKKLNIASIDKFSPELLDVLASMRLTELNIGAIDKLEADAIAKIRTMKSIKVLKFGISKELDTTKHEILKNLIKTVD